MSGEPQEIEGPDFSDPLTGDQIEVMIRRVAWRQHKRVAEMREAEHELARADVALKRALLTAKHELREAARRDGTRVTEAYINDEAELAAMNEYEVHRMMLGVIPPLRKAFDADQTRAEGLRSLMSRAKEWERG